MRRVWGAFFGTCSAATTRVDSRFFLPLEIFQALYMVAWALTAASGGAVLQILSPADQISIFFLLAPLGIAWFLVALAHVRLERRSISMATVHLFVSARSVFAFLGILSWIAVGALIMIADGSLSVTPLLLMVGPHALCCAVSYRANMQVRYALDDRYPTSSLRVPS